MARVYLETSFLSACVTDRQDPKSIYRREESRRWWTSQRKLHALFIATEVARELSDPGFRRREEALALTSEADVLELDDLSRGLAKILVREKAMPGPEGAGDAIHVAVATVHQVDVLLSWNVKHLANRNKVAHVREICRRVGYVPPDILTPDAFWESEEA